MPSRQTTRLSRDIRRRDVPSLLDALAPPQQTAATAISVEDLSHRFVETGVEASPGRPPLALLVHGFLSAAECQSIVDRVANSFIPSDRLYPPSYRNNSLFDMFDAPFAEALYERMAPLLPTELVWPNRNTATAVLQDVELATWRPCSLNQLWRFSRYSNGQSFPPHLDGHYLPAPGLESKVSVTLYLNDNFEGGHTIFYSDKTLASEVLRVTPRTGTLALFDHDLWHDGSPVVCQLERKNHDKIILRSDVVFALQGAQPMSEERSLQLAERSERAAELIVAERPGASERVRCERAKRVRCKRAKRVKLRRGGRGGAGRASIKRGLASLARFSVLHTELADHAERSCLLTLHPLRPAPPRPALPRPAPPRPDPPRQPSLLSFVSLNRVQVAVCSSTTASRRISRRTHFSTTTTTSSSCCL